MKKSNSDNIGDSLSPFRKVKLLDKPTVIQPLKNLNKQLEGVEVYVKRDDVMGMGLGGNKLRKLEFLLGDAAQKGSDVVITSGGIQSNHARLTAVAAAYAGLDCELVLTQAVSKDDLEYRENGNILLEKILDTQTYILPPNSDARQFINKRVLELETMGKRTYLIPMGGSSPIGCLGYVSCFREIILQSNNLNVHFNTIIVPNGSGGTQAGLIAGLKVSGIQNINIKSYTVLADQETANNATYEKVITTLNLLDKKSPIEKEKIDINADFLGTGYGIPTKEMVEALKLLARTEGIFLDPVYSGKAFAGMLSDIREGKFEKGSKILFILTGGLPGLFAYRPAFSETFL